MAYYAKIENEIVATVIVAEQDFIDRQDGQWVQTSRYTRGGINYAPNSNEPDGGIALRKNSAGIGYTYDENRDVFIPPKPFSSWILNEETCLWESPVPYPDVGDDKYYYWNEDTQGWVESS